MLNVLTTAGVRDHSPHPRRGWGSGLSQLTRFKISVSLMGRKDSEVTRMIKSKSRMGNLNPQRTAALNKAAEMAGTKVYVYTAENFAFVNIFRSLRSTCNVIPISYSTLVSKLDTDKSFKGYYYYTNPSQPLRGWRNKSNDCN